MGKNVDDEIDKTRISNFDGFTNESTGTRTNPIIQNWKNGMRKNADNTIGFTHQFPQNSMEFPPKYGERWVANEIGDGQREHGCEHEQL